MSAEGGVGDDGSAMAGSDGNDSTATTVGQLQQVCVRTMRNFHSDRTDLQRNSMVWVEHADRFLLRLSGRVCLG